MVNINVKFVPIICLCFIGAHFKESAPWVWPQTFVDDGQQEQIEFTCGAYLKPDEKLQWYRRTKYDSNNYKEMGEATLQTTGITQKQEGNITIKLIWPLALLSDGDQVLCNKGPMISHNPDTFKSNEVQLKFTKDRFKSMDITTYGYGPWLTPKTFVDDGRRVIEITCYAYLYHNKLLTWYQIQKSDEKKPAKLAWTKQEADYGYAKLMLRKRLEPSDNGSHIYCSAEQNNKEPNKESKRIPVQFQKPEAKESAPWVWPQTFVDDGQQEQIEFTCGAHLKPDDKLQWYRKTKYDSNNNIEMPEATLPTTGITQSTQEGNITIKLIWPLALLSDGDQVYCDKEHLSYHNPDTFMSLIKSNEVQLKFTKDRFKSMDIKTYRYGPWLTPKTFVDDGRRVIEITCYAYLYHNRLLTWYQIQKPDEKPVRLAWIKQEADYGYAKLMLRKRLEPSDNGTEIYCSAEQNTEEPNKESKRIPVQFQKPEEPPRVTVEPNTGIIFFDEEETLELVCKGSKRVDGSSISWHIKDFISHQQSYHTSTNLNYLRLPMRAENHRMQLHCVQEFERKQSEGNVSMTLNNPELARSRPIELLHRAQCDTAEKSPQVTPANFVDDGKQFIQFTCYAFLQTGERLSWYKTKGGYSLRGSNDILLRTVQLQDPRPGGQWVVLDLKKTLEPTDNDREIYCVKGIQTRQLDDLTSHKIPIKIDREKVIQPLEPASVIVEPSGLSFYFEAGTTRSFKCIGSKPIDGRNYTWFINGSESGLLPLPEVQKYDASTYINVLEISLNEAHHLKTLFCAQGLFTYIRHNDGSLESLLYSVLGTSHKINLIQLPEKTSPASTSTPEKPMTPSTMTTPTIPLENRGGLTHTTILAVVIPLVLVTLVAVGLALWVLCGRREPRHRRAPPPPAVPPTPAVTGNTDDIYVNLARPRESPEVTYAVLDLPRKPAVAPRPKRAPEATLYAEIVGVCNK